MMEKSQQDKVIALFLICLVIFLPINGTAVFAFERTFGPGFTGGPAGATGAAGQYVTIKEFMGQDGFPDFRQRFDTISIVVQASLGSNVTVNPNNLEVFFSGFALGQFQSCTVVSEQSNIYECSFTENNGTGPATENRQTYTVNLVNGSNVVATTSGSITVDSNAPSIIKFQPATTLTSQPNTTVTFDVKDYAFGATAGVGLYEIAIDVDGVTQFTYPEETTQSSSSGSSRDTFNTGGSAGSEDGEDLSEFRDTNILITRKSGVANITLGSVSGTHNVCIRAKDWFLQEKTQCTTITVDKDAPGILTDTFKINGESADQELWFSRNEKTLDLQIDFQGADLDISTIYGDFSDAHREGSFSRVIPRCTADVNDVYHCTFQTNIKINETRSYTFSFFANDTLNNEANAHMSANLNFDDTGPVATKISTPFFYEGVYYIGSTTATLTADIREEGIGVNDTQVYIDFSQIGGLSSKQAEHCVEGWRCFWNISADASAVSGLPDLTVIRVDNGTVLESAVAAKRAEVSIVIPATKDDLGNVGNRTTFNLSVDVIPPEIVLENITPISASTDFEGVTVVGDSIFVLLNVSDGSGVTMNILADDFIDNFNESFDCLDNRDGIHTCEAVVGPITNEGYYNGDLTIVLSDTVGNLNVQTRTFEVLEIINGTTDFWNGEVTGCSPSPLDRELVDKFPQDVYCGVGLSSGNAEIYDLSEGPCSDQGAKGRFVSGNFSTLSTFSWLGIPRNEPNLIVNVVTTTFDPRVDSVEYACTVNVRSIVAGRGITRDFEPVNVSVSVPLYNSPIGEVNQVVWDRVDALYRNCVKGDGGSHDANKEQGYVDEYIVDGLSEGMCDIAATLSYLTTFFEASQKICDIANTIYSLLSLWDKIQLAWGLANSGIISAGLLGFTKPATEPAKQKSNIAKSLGDYSNAAADLALKEGWEEILGYYCAFISCKLAYGDTWVGAWQEGVAAWISWAYSLGFTEYLETGDLRAPRAFWFWKGDFKGAETGTEFKERDGSSKFVTAESKPKDGADPTGKVVAPLVTGRVAGDSTDPPDPAAPGPDPDPDPDPGKASESSLGTLHFPLDPKENWVVSVLTLCIPGILYNLEKFRQIQCAYGSCLISNAEAGIPLFMCDQNKAYAECKFIWGSIFQLVPFAQFLSDIQHAIANIMANPLILIDVAIGWLCEGKVAASQAVCATDDVAGCISAGWGVFGCEVYSIFNLGNDLYQDIKGYFDDDWEFELGPETGACGDFADAYKDLRSGGDPPPEPEQPNVNEPATSPNTNTAAAGP